MNTPTHSQRVMESALEIAYLAGHMGFQTDDSREMFSLFQDWAIKFEAEPYQDEDWMELIQDYALEMLWVAELRGTGRLGSKAELYGAKSLTAWKILPAHKWVYLPDNSERLVRKSHFLALCEGNEAWAFHLFKMCKGEQPKAVLEAAGGLALAMLDADMGYGRLAMDAGRELQIQVLSSGRLYYIGTECSEDHTPFSRESEEYYPTMVGAINALQEGSWTQRTEP